MDLCWSSIDGMKKTDAHFCRDVLVFPTRRKGSSQGTTFLVFFTRNLGFNSE